MNKLPSVIVKQCAETKAVAKLPPCRRRGKLAAGAIQMPAAPFSSRDGPQ